MKIITTKTFGSRALGVAVSACLLAACAGSPQRPPELVRLESELSRKQSDPVEAGNAGSELAEAQQAINVIARDGRRMRSDMNYNNIYLADRFLQIAEAEGRASYARQQTDRLSTERERLVADARTLEAVRASYAAERARRDAEQAMGAANAARDQAES
jgi:hypothetical protein